MRMNVYSIYDVASAAYTRPFFFNSDGQAVRTFTDMAINAEHEVGAHPEDYTLFRIGTFDDNKGTLVPEDPEALVTALECVAKSREVNGAKLKALDNAITVGEKAK